MSTPSVPRVKDSSWLGSFGPTTAERLAFQRDLAARSEPLVRGRVLHLPVYFPCTAEAAHDVLVTHAKSFEKSPGLRILLHHLAGQGLFTSEAALWKTQRKMMSPLFHPAPIQRYADTMRLVAERAADALHDGQSIDVAHETTRIAMSVVGKALFDVDTFDEADELGAALTTALGWVNKNLAHPGLVAHVLAGDASSALASKTSGRVRALFERINAEVKAPFSLPGVRSPELAAAVGLVDDRVQRMIDDRRRQGLSRQDLLTLLLTANDPEDPTSKMSDKQVRDEAVTLFVAGHETTATALAWSFYLLARHPDALARARAEADAFPKGPIEKWEPERLAFCTRVFREAMRIYPPIMMLPRRSLETVTIAGVTLPPRSLVFLSIYGLHHRADVYPEPTRFDPDRWLPEVEATRHRTSYLPFGAGPRICLGIHFAMMEGPLVLAKLLQRWSFEIDPHKTIEPDDFATLRPKGGVPAVVRARAS
ncbi:MAG: cytochrome P450 [Polyangiaceae bacterium]